MTPDAVHVVQVEPALRQAIEEANAAFQREDEDLERATLKALRETRLQARVPVLCAAARAVRPNLSVRRMLIAVSLVTGISRTWVETLYYNSMRSKS